MKFLISTLLLTSLLFCEITTGKIVDIHGNPIRGAIISHQNTSTHSDEGGTFRLKSSGKGRVSVEHVGYKTITLERSKYMRVVMQQRVILTEDVIVTSQLKSTSIKDVNSSINIFEPEDIALFLKYNSVLNVLDGGKLIECSNQILLPAILQSSP